ncbi:RNA polymerase sigma factor [Bacillus phage Staley]|uniref:RNA polymerase sigma 70 factor n=1 Tax=Bacillus phage Staley TaxID=1406792 RepID=U5Q1H3_9CAUD|nr:RNA polymerase sigma factor [Bacillus phage Staley]AGY48783.1 RNA polymerase sigma 70 factor [Bacillus phage Staley]
MYKTETMIEGVLENRDDHVQRNLRLIWSVVYRFQNRGYDNNDLFQLASIGYLKAFDKFDDSFKVKWSTYAVPMMIGEIQRFIRDDGIIKSPRRLKEWAAKFRMNECEGLKREEIAEKLELDLSEVDELLYYLKVRNPAFIEQTVYENDGDPITLADQVGDFDDYSHTFVNEFLETLDERTVNVVKLVMDGKTQNEIGELIGVTQVQVSRIIKNKVKPLLENYLKGQGQFDNVVKERAQVVRKPSPKNIKKQESVVTMFNAKKPLNGLTVEIYHKMRNEGKSNGKIMKFFRLNNASYYGWKKENGLTDTTKSAVISNQRKGVSTKKKQQGDSKDMMATAIKPDTSASQVSKLDKVITNLEETVESYKSQVSSRDQEIKRIQKQMDQQREGFEEAVATLNTTWENKVLEKESVINQLQTSIKHKDSNVKYVKDQFAQVVSERDSIVDKAQLLQKELDSLTARYTNLEEDYNNRDDSYKRVLSEKREIEEGQLVLEAKLEQVKYDFDNVSQERDRYEGEAHEFKRLYEEQLKRANELEAANLSYKQELTEVYDCNASKDEIITELEEKNNTLAEKVQSYDKNIDRILEEANHAQRLHQEETKELHDKIEKLQVTLKLYL